MSYIADKHTQSNYKNTCESNCKPNKYNDDSHAKNNIRNKRSLQHCSNGKQICEDIKNHFNDISLKTRFLTQEDFEHGTYRIRKPGIYVFKEDIVFDANPEDDYRPRPDQEKYKDAGFSLGFFAGITVETKDVIIDLNGKTFRQSNASALQQRFFALIELANQPFIHKQGPGDFGKDLHAADYCWIRNGKFGLSSHHAIHGNGPRNVLIEDVEMFNFEVAGIAINGGKYICVDNVNVGPNRKDVPVNGNYSALRFLIPFYQRMIQILIDRSVDPTTLQNMLESLVVLSQSVLEEVLLTGRTTNPIFENPSGLLDGNVYGILFHPIGVAINDFIEENFSGDLSKYISISNVNIHGLSVNVNEVIGISANRDGKGAVLDPSGSVFQIEKVMTNGVYTGNILSNAQIILAKVALEQDVKLGKMNIPQDLINWAISDPSQNIQTLLDLGYKYKCNGDSMFHVNKGIVGIRLDGVRHVFVDDVKIRYIENIGKLGNETLCGSYEYSHDQQIRKGYRGANTFGTVICYGQNVQFKNVFMTKLRSINGSAFGFCVMNQSSNILFDKIKIVDVKAGYKYLNGKWYGIDYYGNDVELTLSYPNLCPIVAGIIIEDDNCQAYKIGDYRSSKLSGPCLAAHFIHIGDQTPHDQDDDSSDDDSDDYMYYDGDCPHF